jgi:hypothetical protein
VSDEPEIEVSGNPQTFLEAGAEFHAAGRQFMEDLGKIFEPALEFMRGVAEGLPESVNEQIAIATSPPRSRLTRFADWMHAHQPHFYWFLGGSLVTTLVGVAVHR